MRGRPSHLSHRDLVGCLTGTAFQEAVRPLAVRLPASHMTGEPGWFASTAVATVLIIGASRGIGLETVKAALKAGHSVRALARSARRIRVAQARKNGRRRARDGHDKARANRRRCYHPVARCFGRARNHPQADAAFLQSDASARYRDGRGSRQAVDLRDGLPGRRQPWAAAGSFVVQRFICCWGASITGLAGTHRPQEQARLGDRASRDPDQRTPIARWSIRAAGHGGSSRAPT
jgi:hypothetical protein